MLPQKVILVVLLSHMAGLCYPHPRPKPAGCHHEGNIYPPGTYFATGSDRDSNWCYGMYCDKNGELMAWDDFNCFFNRTTLGPKTSEPSSKIPETPATPTTPSSDSTSPPISGPTTTMTYNTNVEGCLYEGVMYPASTNIVQRYDRENLWCYDIMCDVNRKLVRVENVPCTITPPMSRRHKLSPLETELKLILKERQNELRALERSPPKLG